MTDTTEIKPGDVVLVESAVWRAAYGVAVVGQRITAKRVGLRKIERRWRRDEAGADSYEFVGLAEEERLRDRAAIISVFPAGTDPWTAWLAQEALRKARDAAHEKATRDYFVAARALTASEPAQ